jgi:hypothetical protein
MCNDEATTLIAPCPLWALVSHPMIYVSRLSVHITPAFCFLLFTEQLSKSKEVVTVFCIWWHFCTQFLDHSCKRKNKFMYNSQRSPRRSNNAIYRLLCLKNPLVNTHCLNNLHKSTITHKLNGLTGVLWNCTLLLNHASVLQSCP